ncbi:putative 3-hydroxyisobutyrate dehydrogenase protein [Neofusicoccum parvum UCRNP2]|uniref:Putative 3-hydroxyisobutyrate dehydrogenase protein n=1 Tax=Botryosphaeria parva (strain UCR-NP2) TaxID=1287680 RepID=R1EJU9_BOTPV|nr:putative 3-hydroxyisobutyrate dehydrogenase protein [Neofusicoccum parvum UCRNP2]
MSEKPAVGFVGLGAMGFGMATNLVKQGYRVKGFDVFQKSVERFAQAGGVAAASLADSATDTPFHVLMVASADQAQQALFGDGGIVKALPQGATLLLCSTVPSAYAQSVDKQLADAGRSDVFFVDAPVSGGAKRAADGTLTIMVGASDAATEKARWLLEEMSDPKGLYIVPGGVGQGSNMKMVHQVLAAIQILLASEAHGFAARLGLDAQEVYDAVCKSPEWFWMYENRVPRLLVEDYTPGVSALTIILKDAGIITSTARLVNFPTPLSSAAEQVYLIGLAQGLGPIDDSAMVRTYFPEPVSSVKSQANGATSSGDKLALVFKLLRGVLLLAAAEAISFADYLKLDLHQFYDLASGAAGGSIAFRERGAEMIEFLTGKKVPGAKDLPPLDVKQIRDDLAEAITIGRQAYGAVPLGGAALNLLTSALRTSGGQKEKAFYGLLP